VGGDRLELDLPVATGGLPQRVLAMQPSPGVGPFDDAAYLFEPWWPGVRTLVWVEGARVTRLQVDGLADAMAAFPEVGAELPAQLMADETIIDGWLLVLDDGGWLDADLLRRRLAGDHGAGRPAFVASDLLWSGGASLQRRPFSSRRELLEAILPDGDRCMVGHALRREGTLLAEALRRFGFTSLSARRLDARFRSGVAGDAWLRVPIEPATLSERPRLALIQRLPFEVT
jgi:bifunctional non-homologous end joining protein LigD